MKNSKTKALTSPSDRSIVSLEITSAVSCAFFTLEACIHPQGTADMLVQGPAYLDKVPNEMLYAIQAYICGSEAATFSLGATMEPGTVIVNNKDATAPQQDVFELAARSEPIEEIPADSGDIAADGRGATIFKQQNLQGSQVPGDKTAVPGNTYCADLSNIFGNWDGKVRSLKVEPGYRCKFFTAYGCPASGQKLELGKKGVFLVANQLPTEFDEKIHSVICSKL